MSNNCAVKKFSKIITLDSKPKTRMKNNFPKFQEIRLIIPKE